MANDRNDTRLDPALSGTTPDVTRAAANIPEGRAEMIRRLKRIEGQLRGIQRMIQQDRGCREVLDQLSAVQQGVRSVSALVATDYAVECLERAKQDAAVAPEETAAALVDALLHAPR